MQNIQNMQLMPQEAEFEFEKMCPYCKGNLICEVESFIQDDNGQWMAIHIQSMCKNEPEESEGPNADQWLNKHMVDFFRMQHSANRAMMEYINQNYRFDIKKPLK